MFRQFFIVVISFFLTINAAQAEVLVQDVRGEYQLKVQFGERIFDDIMIVEKAVPTQGNRHRDVLDISGTFTVPGGFSVPFHGTLCPHDPEHENRCILHDRGFFQIEFTADEGSGPFHVAIIGTIFPQSLGGITGFVRINNKDVGRVIGGTAPYYANRAISEASSGDAEEE